MKKKSNQGFMLAETLIVASFISITLIYLFVQFRNINNSYSDTLMYNSVNGMYINNEIKKFITKYDIEELSLKLAYEDKGYYDLTSCDATIFTDTAYCQEFFSRLNVKTAIYTLAKTNVVGSDFSEKFKKFLHSIYNPNSKMYIIASELNDGSFASLKLNGYNYPALEDIILKQGIVSSGSGLYNVAKYGELIFRGDTIDLKNNISVFGMKGKIISITNQGVKVILSTKSSVTFNNLKTSFTKDSALIKGKYLSKSITNSVLYSSLNNFCSEGCSGLVRNSIWSVGDILILAGNNLDSIITSENKTQYQGTEYEGFFGTLSVSDIIKSSNNSNCNYDNITNNCLQNNWLNGDYFTFNANTSDRIWSIDGTDFVGVLPNTNHNAYLIVYIDKKMSAIGEGTVENPFRAL